MKNAPLVPEASKLSPLEWTWSAMRRDPFWWIPSAILCILAVGVITLVSPALEVAIQLQAPSADTWEIFFNTGPGTQLSRQVIEVEANAGGVEKRLFLPGAMNSTGLRIDPGSRQVSTVRIKRIAVVYGYAREQWGPADIVRVFEPAHQIREYRPEKDVLEIVTLGDDPILTYRFNFRDVTDRLRRGHAALQLAYCVLASILSIPLGFLAAASIRRARNLRLPQISIRLKTPDSSIAEASAPIPSPLGEPPLAKVPPADRTAKHSRVKHSTAKRAPVAPVPVKPSPSPPLQVQPRDVMRWLPWAAGAIVLGSRLILVAFYGSDFPFGDLWPDEVDQIFIPFSKGTLHVADFFAPIGAGHIIALTRFLSFMEFLLTARWSPYLELQVQCVFPAVLAALLIYWHRKDFGDRWSLSLVLLVATLALPVTWFNMIVGTGSQHTGVVLFSIILLRWAAVGDLTKSRFFAIAGLGVLAGVTSGNGFIAGFVGAFALIFRAALGKRKRSAILAVVLLVESVILYRLGNGSFNPHASTTPGSPFALAEAMMVVIGWPNWPLQDVGLLFLWTPMACCAFVLLKLVKRISDVGLFGLSLCAWSFINVLATAYARGGYGGTTPQPRYADVLAVAVFATVFLCDHHVRSTSSNRTLVRAAKILGIIVIGTFSVRQMADLKGVSKLYRDAHTISRQAVTADRIHPGVGLEIFRQNRSVVNTMHYAPEAQRADELWRALNHPLVYKVYTWRMDVNAGGARQ